MKKVTTTQPNNNNSKNTKKIIDPAQCKRLFTKFSKGKQFMSDDDLFQFFTKDLGLAGDDQQFGHIVTNIMGVKKIQETNLDNFTNLFKYVGAGSLGDLHIAIKQGKFLSQLKSAETYKSMYKKVFDLYSGKFTTLELQIASALWQVYLKGKLKFYDQFFQYLGTLDQKTKIHKDSWNMMLDFSNEIKDIKECKQEDGWAVLIDNFAEWMKKK